MLDAKINQLITDGHVDMKKYINVGLLVLTTSLLITGCDSDKDKAIKAAESKITSLTDLVTGLKFTDMQYLPSDNGTSCVFGKYRTDQLRETRFVLVVDKEFKVVGPITIEDHRHPGVQDFIWENPCG